MRDERAAREKYRRCGVKRAHTVDQLKGNEFTAGLPQNTPCGTPESQLSWALSAEDGALF
jgi:hypothetical protein